MKALVVLAFFAVPSLAFAVAGDIKIYKDTFPGKEVSCKTCHTKGKELNAYGQKIVDAGGDRLSALKKVGPAN